MPSVLVEADLTHRQSKLFASLSSQRTCCPTSAFKHHENSREQKKTRFLRLTNRADKKEKPERKTNTQKGKWWARRERPPLP